MIYVSPTQINLQGPLETPIADVRVPNVPVVVTTSVGASETVNAYLAGAAGMFTLDGSGCGRGVVLNYTNGALSLNSPDNSAERGGILVVYATGWAANAFPLLEDGMPAPADPPRRYIPYFRSFLRGKLYSDNVLFAGAAPMFAGVDQINLRLPDDAPEACSVPLQLESGFQMTQTIPISIRRGGGRCLDPPPDSLAVLRWTKTVSSGVTPPPPTDTLSIEFSSAIGKAALSLSERGSRGEVIRMPGPYCPGFEDRQLDAGVVAANGPRSGVPVKREMANGVPRYSANTAPGLIEPGAYTVTASGGPDIGPFTTTLDIPEPIRITTDFPPGTVLDSQKTIFVRWEGGDPNSMVTVRFVSLGRVVNGVRAPLLYKEQTIPASAGVVMRLALYPYGVDLPHEPMEIVVTQTPDPARIGRFQAPGLTLGGWHLWTYVFRFGGLRLS